MGRDSILNYSLGDKNIGQTSEDLVNRPLQKRERTGKEYGCFSVCLKNYKIFK